MQLSAAGHTKVLLCRRVFLPSGFDTRENPGSRQYDRTNNNPVSRQVQQVRAINQAGR